MKKTLSFFIVVLICTAANLLIGISASAQYTKLHDFTGNPDGRTPYGSLISDGTFLYGVTQGGGINNYGTLFKIKPDGTGYVKLFDFNGGSPNKTLISDGTFFYGTIPWGGTNGKGAIFKILPNGTGYADLYSFSGNPDGQLPEGDLIFDGTFLYGMTYYGGTSGYGTIFKILPSGTGFVKMFDFTGAATGRYPNGSLISDGTFLYGMTVQGGTNDSGAVFKIMPNGTGYSKLSDFSLSKGYYPYGSLILGGTFLYGMTSGGGVNDDGVIFKIKPDGTGYSKLLDFNSTNGSKPQGSLVADGGILYGMAYQGGANNMGVLFKILSNGTGYSKLLDFAGAANGKEPGGDLFYDGTFLYGMANTGGTTNNGVVFKYLPPIVIDSIHSTKASCHSGTNGTAAVATSGGLTPYTYLWNSSPLQTTQTATGLAAGNYTVAVTDANNTTSTASVTISQPNVISIIISPANSNCDNSGSASSTVSGGTSPYSYLWSSGQTTSAVTGLAGINYTLTITDANSCIATQTTSIGNNTPPAPSICLITVDSLSQNNLIVWDKTTYAHSDTFLIYRDTANNAYGIIGKVPYDSLSMFADTVRTLYAADGNPNVTSWRYKLAVKDSCGNISAKSLFHQSIYIQNSSGNFSWNHYQIEGQAVPVPALQNYLFQRDNLSNGNYVIIQTLSASSTSYTDPAYATYQSTATWRVKTLWNISCTPTIIKDPQTMVTNLNSSRSNIYRINNPISVHDVSLNNLILIHPNPSSGKFNVKISQVTDLNMKGVEIYNVYGECMYKQIGASSNIEIDLSEVLSGIYFICIQTEQGTAAKKLIIE